MTSYLAHGLQIDSEVPLPELRPGSNRAADVHIRYGSVPTALPDPVKSCGFFQAAPDTLLLTVKDVGRYLVTHGRDIVVEPLPDCSEDLVRVFLLGSTFGALLHQRHLLVMHASSIETARGAVLFVGPRGHGKSTLLAALVDRGHAMLADDVTAVSVESPSGPVAFGAFPRQRLCTDTATRFDHPLEALPRVPSSNKYLVPVPRFCPGPLPVHAIYALDVHEAADIHLESVNAAQRFALVGRNTYRSAFLFGLGLSRMHFHAAARLARSVQVACVTRPVTPFMLDELVDRLEEEFGGPEVSRTVPQ